MNPKTGRSGLAGPHWALQTGSWRAGGGGQRMPPLPHSPALGPAALARWAAAGEAALCPKQEGGCFASKTCKSSCAELQGCRGVGEGSSHVFVFT